MLQIYTRNNILKTVHVYLLLSKHLNLNTPTLFWGRVQFISVSYTKTTDDINKLII